MSFLGLNLAFQRRNFGLELSNVVHGCFVFLSFVNLRLNFRDLLLDCRHYITPPAGSPDPMGRAPVLQSDVLNRHGEH